jgi:hypothetical protein
MPGFAYLDASALVKLAVLEPETPALERDLLDRDALFSSAVAVTELMRAARRTNRPRLLQQVDTVLDSVFLADVTAAICEQAGRLGPPTLRALDALHIATAVSLSLAGLDFITYDDRQVGAAEATGLRVRQPGREATP